MAARNFLHRQIGGEIKLNVIQSLADQQGIRFVLQPVHQFAVSSDHADPQAADFLARPALFDLTGEIT